MDTTGELKMDTIGERIKKLRKENKLTQQDLAEKTDISRGNLSNYEKDRFKPASDAIISLAKFFNVSTDWLLTGKEFKSHQDNLINKDESELMNLYMKCSDNNKKEIFFIIKSYLSSSEYAFKKSISVLSEDEAKLLELYRHLTSKDKIKIEGIVESKLAEAEDNKRGKSYTYQPGEETATLVAESSEEYYAQEKDLA